MDTSELQFNHIHCESTDDESDIENTLLINKLKTDHEFKALMESKYYQNDIISFNPQETDKNQLTPNQRKNNNSFFFKKPVKQNFSTSGPRKRLFD